MPDNTTNTTQSDSGIQGQSISLSSNLPQRQAKSATGKKPVSAHAPTAPQDDPTPQSPASRQKPPQPKQKTTTPQQQFPQQQPPSHQQQQLPPRQQPDPGGFDDWGFGDFGAGTGGFGGAPGSYGAAGGAAYSGAGYGRSRPGASPTGMGQQKRLTPEERVQMIETVYDEILCRKPDTRDINYYKYSTLNEDQIRKQLIASAEHKDMVKKGREYTKLKEHAEQLETRVKMLEGQLRDHVEEFRELSNLLQEKNRQIQQLRDGNAIRMPSPPKHIPSDQNMTPRGAPPSPEQMSKESPADPTPLKPTAQSPQPEDSNLLQPSLKSEDTDLQTKPQPEQTEVAPVFTSDTEPPPPPEPEENKPDDSAESGKGVLDSFTSIFRTFF